MYGVKREKEEGRKTESLRKCSTCGETIHKEARAHDLKQTLSRRIQRSDPQTRAPLPCMQLDRCRQLQSVCAQTWYRYRSADAIRRACLIELAFSRSVTISCRLANQIAYLAWSAYGQRWASSTYKLGCSLWRKRGTQAGGGLRRVGRGLARRLRLYCLRVRPILVDQGIQVVAHL